MAMSRKHYQEAAEIIKTARFRIQNDHERLIVNEIASDLASMFKRDNSNFDRERFMEATR